MPGKQILSSICATVEPVHLGNPRGNGVRVVSKTHRNAENRVTIRLKDQRAFCRPPKECHIHPIVRPTQHRQRKPVDSTQRKVRNPIAEIGL